MACFLLQCLLVLDITLSLLTFAEPQSCKHQRTFGTGGGEQSLLHPDLGGTLQTHRGGKGIHIYPYQCQYPYTHTPPQHTQRHTPTSVPATGIRPPVAHLYPLLLPRWLHRAPLGRRLADGSDQRWLHITRWQQHTADGKFSWARKALLSLFLSTLKREKGLISCFPIPTLTSKQSEPQSSLGWSMEVDLRLKYPSVSPESLLIDLPPFKTLSHIKTLDTMNKSHVL